MSIFDQPFNPNEHRQERSQGEYDDDPILSKGYYQVMLVDMKEDESGGNWALFKWKITAGAANGQVVSVFENLSHRDGGEKAQKALKIFRARLANYCDMAGIDVVTDSSQLLNRPVKAFFKPWVRGDGSSVNQITHFRNINDKGAVLSQKRPIVPNAGGSSSQIGAQNEWSQAAASAEPKKGIPNPDNWGQSNQGVPQPQDAQTDNYEEVPW